MKEVLSLLNNSNPDNRAADVVMGALLDWLRGSPQTLLLCPCIRATTRHLASLEHMVTIVETCLELAFIPSKAQPTLTLFYFFQVCLGSCA